MELMKNTAFMELNDSEMNEVNGGGFWACVGGAVVGYAVTKVLDKVGKWTGWW